MPPRCELWLHPIEMVETILSHLLWALFCEMVRYAFKIVDHFNKLHNMPTETIDDLSEATVKQTIDLLDFIIKSFVTPSA